MDKAGYSSVARPIARDLVGAVVLEDEEDGQYEGDTVQVSLAQCNVD